MCFPNECHFIDLTSPKKLKLQFFFTTVNIIFHVAGQVTENQWHQNSTFKSHLLISREHSLSSRDCKFPEGRQNVILPGLMSIHIECHQIWKCRLFHSCFFPIRVQMMVIDHFECGPVGKLMKDQRGSTNI